MSKLYRSLLWSGLVVAGVAACGDNVTVTPPPPPVLTVHSVSVAPSPATINIGGTVQLVASVNADAGIATTVTWSPGTPAIATVSASGLVTGVAAGTAAVTACSTVVPGICGSATIVVQAAPTATVTQVNVNPPTANLSIGQTITPAAAVVGTNNPAQTVTWSLQTAGAIVSVNATTGLITALAAGSAVVKACSTVTGFTGVCGSIAVTVVPTNPASVQVTSVTWVPPTGPATCAQGPGPVVPVVLTSVRCQIEITVQVNSGDLQLSRVDVLIGGQVMASQTFSTTPSGPETAPISSDITLSTNTAQVRRLSGLLVPVVFNGNSGITAQLFVVGSSTPIASNAIPVTMNNVDALVALGTAQAIPAVTLTANTATPTFTDGSGNVWFKGASTFSGAQYVSFSTKVPTAVGFTSSVCGTSSSTVTGTAAAGIALTGGFTCANAEGANTVTGFAAPVYTPPLNGPDGTPLTPPVSFSNLGGGFTVNGELRWNLITPAVPTQVMPILFIDNKAPVVTIASTVAFNSAWDQPWINSSTYNLLSNISSVDGGTGVANTTARVWTGTCPLPDLPNPSNLAQTITSNATDGWRICGASVDNIGNVGTSGASNFFGVDTGAPTDRIAGSTTATPTLVTAATANVSATANTTIFGIAAQAAFGVSGPAVATDQWGLEALDTRSGFNQTPVLGVVGAAIQSLAILNPGGASCTIASSAFSAVSLSDTWVRSFTTPGITCGVAGQPGYYTYTAHAVDRAGNNGPVVGKNYAVDQVAAPNITGLGFAAALYTPGNPAPFGFSANDDLEIIDGTLAVSQTIPSSGATALRYPLGSLTPLGTRWDATLTNVLNGQNASIPYFIFRVDETCSAAATPYASCPAPGAPQVYITAPKAPTAGNYTANAAALPTSVSANVADVAWQLAAAPIAAPMLNTQFSPNTGISQPWTGADLVSWDLDLTSAPGTAKAIHVASTSIVIPYFDNASLWRLYGTEWVYCTAFGAPALTDNGLNRFWTYSVAVPTTGACSIAGGGLYRAMGTKAGAGLFTPSR